MNLKKTLVSAFIVCLFFISVSCNKIESDAKKAAGLTNKSIEYTVGLELEKGEKAYKESQEILLKYQGHKNETEFLKHYRRYRDEGKVRPMEEL